MKLHGVGHGVKNSATSRKLRGTPWLIKGKN